MIVYLRPYVDANLVSIFIYILMNLDQRYYFHFILYFLARWAFLFDSFISVPYIFFWNEIERPCNRICIIFLANLLGVVGWCDGAG